MDYQTEGIRRVAAKLHSEGMTVPSKRTQTEVGAAIASLRKSHRQVLEQIYGLQTNSKPKTEMKLAQDRGINLFFIQQDHRVALEALYRRLTAE